MKIICVRRYFYRLAIPLIIAVSLFLSGIYFISERTGFSVEMILRIGHGLIMTAGLWTGCLIIVNWLWLRYPWQEKAKKHLLLEILMIFLYTMIFSTTIYFFEQRILGQEFEISLYYDIFVTFLITYFITAIHEAYYFYRQWKLNFSKSIKLERDNIEANFEALKNQINPHFLFNSLNSLTGMVEDRPEAVDYIANLSDFLRYLLKTGEKELVSVEEELEIVEKYINLQRSRFGDSLKLNVNLDMKDRKKNLPPLVLQMLTENAIKHNIVSADRPLEIGICTDQQSLCVKNNLNRKTGVPSTGKGLFNIRERYALYTGKKVEVTETKEYFEVRVPLLNFQE